MKIKRLIAGALALTMLVSMALTSCNREKEPPKSKRTNVYSGEEIILPDGIEYVNRTSYGNGKLYLNYGRTYTVTINDLGEEVERRVGYYWQSYENSGGNDYNGDGVDDGMAVVPRSSETTSAVDTDGVVNEPIEVYEGEGENSLILPEGWYLDYITVEYICIIDPDDKSINEIELPNIETSGYMQTVVVGNDGIVNMIYQEYTYNEETMESRTYYNIVRFDPNTKSIVETVDLSEILASIEGIDVSNMYISGMYCTDGGDYYIQLDTQILTFDSSFNFLSKLDIDIGNGWIYGMNLSGSALYIGIYNGGKYSLKVVENGAVSDIQLENSNGALQNMYNILGVVDEKLYFTTSTGISVLDFTTDTVKEELNYINSDLSPNNVGQLFLIPDGRITAISTDYDETQTTVTVAILKRIPDEELKEEIIVKIGSLYTNYDITNSIIEYNKQNNGTRISLVTYEQYNNEENDWMGAKTQLSNDIITGNAPDIIVLDNSLPVDSYFQKGVFADLNKFADDPELGIDKTKLLTNILDATTVDGKLFSIIMTYTVRTLTAKSEHVGTKIGWTFEEMMDCINSQPEGTREFFELGRYDILRDFFQYAMGCFVDWNTGEVYFEDQTFIDFIEYLKTCPEKGYWNEYYDSMGPDYVYDADAERELQEKFSLRFFNDTGLFNTSYYSSFTSYFYDRNDFATTEITPIGFPTRDGSNGSVIEPLIELAISSKSPVQEQAWDVIKYIMNSDSITDSYQFTLSRESLEKKAAEAIDEYYYYDNSNEDYSWYKDSGYSDEYIEYMKNSNLPFDQAGVDKMMEIITTTTRVSRMDTELFNIVNEELSSFFAGTKSAAEAAKIIAGRVKIYVQEHS